MIEGMKFLPDKIHVVLAVYDPRGTYSRHAGVVLVSMFSNTKSSMCVHILHDKTLNEDNKSKFIEQAEKFGQELKSAMTEFEPLAHTRGEIVIPAEQLDGESARELFGELELLLKESNPECMNLTNKLRLIPNSGELIQKIEDFDFKSALDILAKLRKKF